MIPRTAFSDALQPNKADGLLDEKNKRAAAEKAAQAPVMTFDEMAEKYLAAHEAGWKGSTSSQQWSQSLRDYVSPHIGGMDVKAITEADVFDVLNPIWRVMPETANRVRGRIETILDYAGRNGSNPARWETLRFKLPKKTRLRNGRRYDMDNGQNSPIPAAMAATPV
jgi:hypothetical protein